MASKISIQFFKKGDRYYQVLADGRVVGEVYYDPDAWADGRWFCVGHQRELQVDPKARGRLTEVMATKKYRGFRSRQLAAAALIGSKT